MHVWSVRIPRLIWLFGGHRPPQRSSGLVVRKIVRANSTNISIIGSCYLSKIYVMTWLWLIGDIYYVLGKESCFLKFSVDRCMIIIYVDKLVLRKCIHTRHRCRCRIWFFLVWSSFPPYIIRNYLMVNKWNIIVFTFPRYILRYFGLP